MIKFFRKIRHQLLKENKFSKYLVYALGEIVLVVIGILIALQLDNWNTDRKASIEELELLTEMKSNLESDLKDCIWNINKNQELLASNELVLQQLEERIPWNDSLQKHYGNLLGTTTQLRNMSAYDHLKSRGLNLIRNPTLRQRITIVYSARYYYIEMKELQYDNPLQLNQVIPQFNGKIVVDTNTKEGYPTQLEQLYKDDALKGTLRTNCNVKRFMINAYSNLQNDIHDLIEQITTELKNRNLK